MTGLRYSAFLFASSILITPVMAKDETLVDRGKRMCEEAGIPLSECRILPPGNRAVLVQQIATTSSSSSQNAVDDQAPFGTGTYGWCDDCTSFFAAAPVKPWSAFGGREYRPLRDEDDNRSSAPLGGATAGGGQGGQGGVAAAGGGGNGGSGDDNGDPGSGGGGKGDRGDSGKGDRGDVGKGGSGGGKGDRGNGGKGGSTGGGKGGSSGR